MAQNPSPPPNMQALATGLQILSKELALFQNIPPITNGQELQAQIHALNQHLEQMNKAINERFDRLEAAMAEKYIVFEDELISANNHLT